jgi:hypothetical protein
MHLLPFFCLYSKKFTNCGKFWSSISFYSHLSNGFLSRSNWKLCAICLYRLRNFRKYVHFQIWASWNQTTFFSFPSMTHSQLLEGLKCESKWKTTEEGGVGMRSLAHNTLRGRGACWSSGMGLGRIDKLIHSHGPAHNPHKMVSA